MKSITRAISGWGRYPIQTCQIIRPERYADLTPQNTPLITSGNGRSYGDAALNDQGIVMLTKRLNRFLAFDKTKGILQAEPGVTLAEILDVVVPAGYFLKVTPGTQFATLGGCVASDVHGKNHHHIGSFANCIIEFELITAQNETLICSAQQNPELFWATIGGMGLTGIIGNVTIQLQPIASSTMVVRHTPAADLDHAFNSLNDPMLDDQYSVAWIDCLAGGKNLGRSILMTAHHASLDELLEKQRAEPLAVTATRATRLPFNLPGWILNSHSIRIFNDYFYKRHAKKSEQFLQHYVPYFYPLDKILEWNRLYGKKGFVQYQCVLPTQHSLNGIKQLLEKISASHCSSFLAVLKRFGVASQGLLSFPTPGFTLALDIPLHGSSIFTLLNELDEIVLKHQGRVYLAKDARLSPETFRQMYPSFAEWLKIKKQIDPDNKFTSSLARRLQMHPSSGTSCHLLPQGEKGK